MNMLSRLEIFKTASICRAFEEKVFSLIGQKVFKYPLYLSAGQEYIPSIISFYTKHLKPWIFGQHRAHSTYLAFGGPVDELIKELLGRKDGCCNGMGGSASIQSKHIKMFGHDGLMGSQIPIAVGACHAKKQFTIAIMGDAAAEEDYVMAAIAWAGAKQLPILFVVEDNNLSILTKKDVRRNWNMADFAKSVNVNAAEIEDKPENFEQFLNNENLFNNLPLLLNVKTDRLYWHAGAGVDDYVKVDRFNEEFKILTDTFGKIPEEVYNNSKVEIENLWQKILEKQ